MDSKDVEGKLLSFFQNIIPYSESVFEIDGDESLIDNGYLDSTGLISLVSFIEENFRFEVRDREIIPENFESLNKIHMYIDSRVLSAG
jgi:acyl carrier protein